MIFKSVKYEDMGNTVARVNRLTGDLSINPVIWEALPAEYRDFVMLHEEGHLKLMTPDEFTANKYAAWKFIECGQLSEAETGRRIMVISDIMGTIGDSKFKRKDLQTSDAMLDFGELFQKVNDGLVILGFGAKGRRKEASEAAKNEVMILAEKSKIANKSVGKNVIYASIAGAFLIFSIVLIFTFRK